jgi:PKD repeat protein
MVKVSGLTVSIRNHTRGADSYRWTFGDGATSTDQSPEHTYADPGTYTITLTATSAAGGTDSGSRQVTVGP